MKTPLTSSQVTARRGLCWLVGIVAVVVAIVFLCAGCQVAQWRVFQKKVDPKMADTPPAQSEGQKRAAAYIVKRTAPPVADPTKAVQDVHQVATRLSASLGEPEKPVTIEDKDAVISSLRDGLLAKEEQLAKWKKFARDYAGKPIEDTGINLAGPAGLVGLLAVVAACVFIPGFGYVLLRLVPVLWSALKRAVSAFEAVASRAPDAVAAIKSALPQKEDGARKAVRLAKRRAVATHPLAA